MKLHVDPRACWPYVNGISGHVFPCANHDKTNYSHPVMTTVQRTRVYRRKPSKGLHSLLKFTR
jgi:hypothetical protein